MNCSKCQREMPDNPCCVVEMIQHGEKYEANVYIGNGLIAHYGPASEEALIQWLHEDAERNSHNLHFHWPKHSSPHYSADAGAHVRHAADARAALRS